MDVPVEQLVERLCAAELGALDVPGLQAHVSALRVAVGRLSGRLDEALGQLEQASGGLLRVHPERDPDAPGVPVQESVQQWWRDSALVTGAQAGVDVRRARVLRDLPVIGRAVTDGRLSPAQAAVLCRLHGAIPEQDLRASQEQLVLVAAGMNPDALGDWVRHLVATHCEPVLDAEQGRARERRYLQLRREPDGTVRGGFVLAAEDAEVVLTVLEPLARRQGREDTRSAGQRRADALVDVCDGAVRWMDLPEAGGQRPHMSYVVHGDWAAGGPMPSLPEQLARQGLHPELLTRTASAAWTGPQTRPRVEAVLCDARLSRLVLDARGAVVALHAVSDQITVAQRRAVSARDQRCLARGCTRPPAFCDVHHLTHRADGGPTTVDNLGLLCRRHHVQWHQGRLARHDLHTPWLPDPDRGDHARGAPWDTHSPPLTA